MGFNRHYYMQYNIDNQSNANLNQSQYMSDADQEMFF